jgi:hypothetical protein
MTTRKTFQCDLCHDAIEKDAVVRAPLNGLGIKWISSGLGGPMKFTFINDSEHHLCIGCIYAIVEAISRTKKSCTFGVLPKV